MKNLTIIVASKVNNAELGEKIHQEATNFNFESQIINLVDLELPLYSTTEEEKNGVPQGAKNLTTILRASDAIVAIAPEYNGSTPPAFNNALAWISRSADNWREAFNGKPTLIATHSGGGGAHVMMAMRQQLSFLGANVLGRQIITNYEKELNLDSLQDCLKQL